MEFYDREKGLRVLGDVLLRSKSEAKMTVLMGRRRIGKTELSLRCGDETILYFFVGKKAESLLCQDYVREIREKLDVPILGIPHTFSEVLWRTRHWRHLEKSSKETTAVCLAGWWSVISWRNFKKRVATSLENGGIGRAKTKLTWLLLTLSKKKHGSMN